MRSPDPESRDLSQGQKLGISGIFRLGVKDDQRETCAKPGRPAIIIRPVLSKAEYCPLLSASMRNAEFKGVPTKFPAVKAGIVKASGLIEELSLVITDDDRWPLAQHWNDVNRSTYKPISLK
ncbi:hypothetical protein EVAR_95844_1 [Eumeta japonica]|uniref:Uncharacterized protein n=1 Tax=Eumeta variegata TaxID=151549 RepID=A0A4C1VL92_EUMVA|nr:hypothetical protein EVAR_95844_1 [Eumeta japonica]